LEVDECVPGEQSVAIVFRDITAFKSLERVKRRAVNHLSHELKTPLAIIKASTENLSKLNPSDPKSAGNLERILRNVQRLGKIQTLVEEILSPPEYRPEAFPILSFMEEVLDDLKERSRHRSVALISHIENVQTDSLDRNIVRMVIETLVKNAIENTPDGGEVTVSLQQTLEGILLQVRDQGVGIPVADQEFIFEGFHHTQATEEYSTKKPFDFNAGGTGLELLRLKVLAERGYFEIAFESSRCKYIPTGRDQCPGVVSSCAYARDAEGCRESGGATFSALFRQGINR
jgi:two-component system phosphate regulon sensor histidine kinase PhoR